MSESERETRIRSYEFYDVRTSMLEHGAVLCRGDERRCREFMTLEWPKALPPHRNLYLVRSTLVMAYKQDGEKVEHERPEHEHLREIEPEHG